MKHTILATLLMLLTGCLGMPDTVTPVADFEISKYLGKWYEIARLDHPFERGLQQITAEYSLREGGGINVKNRGYSTQDGEWQEAEGKAFLVDDDSRGYLKVSFFGPFYGSYVIFELDKTNYQYAFVSGPDLTYLWLLARTPVVAPELIDRFLTEANKRGFDTNEIIYVEHD